MTWNMILRPANARRSAARLAVLALAVASVLTLGCAQLDVPKASEKPTEAKVQQSTASLAVEADGFWSKGNAPQAELLYSRLVDRTDQSPQELAQALDRLAQSSFQAKHYRQTTVALDRRAAADKSVLATWQWHGLYLKALMALSRNDLLDAHQRWIMAHTELPFEVRAQAIVTYAEYVSTGGDPARAIGLLADLHRQAPDAASMLQMEGILTASLREMPEPQFSALAQQAGSSVAGVFPQAIILREAARRNTKPLHSGLAAPAAPAASAAPAVQMAQAAPPSASKAAPVLNGTLLAQNASRVAVSGSDQPAALIPANSGPATVALVLPLTGRFAATGQKVLRGAVAAQKRLAGEGRKLDIKVINSESPDWRAQLSALPPNAAVVGGPLLNTDAMHALQADGTLSRRAVFAFQPDLGNIQEGKQAWRFYPSLHDQARALLTLTADGLGIRSVAVLAPKNRYGQRMAEVFQAEARARGLRVAASETYPPDDHPRWMQSVSHLLKVPDSFRRNKNMPLPMPDFGAVFMPEDWGQAEMLASNFYFFEGQHLLFLGTDLWSVGLDNAKEIDDTYFQHAACPGAWWPETNGGRALQAVLDAQSQGQADFWVALGYDFVRLGARLNLGAGWTPADVNARLAALKGMDFSMAPVVWSPEGIARQNLYVFTPRKEGKALVDVPGMRESIDKARERRERRITSSHETQKAKKAGGSLTRDVQ